MELVKHTQTIFLLIMSLSFLSSCSYSGKQKNDSLELKMEVIGDFPNYAIVTRLYNNTDTDFCLLGLNSKNIFSNHLADSSWHDHNMVFYSLNAPFPPVHSNEEQNHDPSVLIEEYAIFTEFKSFYSNLRESIGVSYDEDTAEYWIMFNSYIFNTSVFIKSGEVWIDTLLTNNYYMNSPNAILKFSIEFPENIMIYDGKFFTIADLINKWNHELGIIVPNTFDGYKVLIQDVQLSDEVIIDPR